MSKAYNRKRVSPLMCVYELELFSKLNQHSKDTLQRHEITHQLYFDI